MDPISALVAVWVACHLLGAMLADANDGAGRHAARLRRLADAGIAAPSWGGPVGRYLGALWRDAMRAATNARHRRFATAAGGRTKPWRTTTSDTPPVPPTPAVNARTGGGAGPGGGGAGPAGSGPGGRSGGPVGEPIRVGPATVGRPTQSSPTPVVVPGAVGSSTSAGWSALARAPWAGSAAVAVASPPTPLPPPAAAAVGVGGAGSAAAAASVTATAIAASDHSGGTNEMSEITSAGVTGVVSGAAAARTIARLVQAANDEYVARLNQIRQAIAVLGEQTVSVVQMSERSEVVGLLMQAAESAAAAQHAAAQLGTEVAPWLESVARAYDLRNS